MTETCISAVERAGPPSRDQGSSNKRPGSEDPGLSLVIPVLLHRYSMTVMALALSHSPWMLQ